MILTNDNQHESKEFFDKLIQLGTEFKLQKEVHKKSLSVQEGLKLIEDMPEESKSLDEVLEEFKEKYLPYCTNFSSPNFMGFPDAGNSVASIGGALLFNFLQQNLINQSFCAPSATFNEINVVRWLRSVVGYENIDLEDIWDSGGIITTGGTSSNTIGILLARENFRPGTLEKGIYDPSEFGLIVPKGIGHYSVKSAQMWLGCGHNLIEVETTNYKYDLKDLKSKLLQNKGKVMGVVVYAGDSRTMSIDNFEAIHNLVKSIDPTIWLHADACHGFSLGLSDKLKDKIKGIELFDSITTDPHKVMATPYVISALLVKDPKKLKSIMSLSDLIMQEPFSFGQLTPFFGSRSWESLKLWFVIKNLGKRKLGEMIEQRHEMAKKLESMLRSKSDVFTVLNKVDINAVAFLYTKGIDKDDVGLVNQVNKELHRIILEEGLFHLHQFSIPDDGAIKKGETVYPLRYMGGNPNTTVADFENLIEYLEKKGEIVVNLMNNGQ